MNRIHSATRYDTPEITALREEINADGRALDEMVREHRRQERERFAQYDDLPYGDHLGCPRPQDREAGVKLPASVRFSSQASRINVHHERFEASLEQLNALLDNKREIEALIRLVAVADGIRTDDKRNR